MNTYSDKVGKNKSHTQANLASQQKPHSNIALKDHRRETLTQRKLQASADVFSNREYLSNNNPSTAQLMSVRTEKKVVGVELDKHIKPLDEQEAWATTKEKPKTTFIADDSEIKPLVDDDTHNFEQETADLGYKTIVGNITTTQWDKIDGNNGAGQPVAKTKDLAQRGCTVGVTKKAGTDDIVINHLANVE
ncbi:hypothetical protein [Thalassotalea atypica]|uniref:hypothetical protein n=1 Tax=Thalassotalea atypica TaxID=2054316 RepID=UPI0025737E94|nr:hypothetical protein [Thalassotalea atypica]